MIEIHITTMNGENVILILEGDVQLENSGSKEATFECSSRFGIKLKSDEQHIVSVTSSENA